MKKYLLLGFLILITGCSNQDKNGIKFCNKSYLVNGYAEVTENMEIEYKNNIATNIRLVLIEKLGDELQESVYEDTKAGMLPKYEKIEGINLTIEKKDSDSVKIIYEIDTKKVDVNSWSKIFNNGEPVIRDSYIDDVINTFIENGYTCK